ncbi:MULTISPECIES: LCP family protein [Streptomyces]|uniref:Cell envelope-related function transcriptional attenuator common domain protein n=1 Tax=Streptomyces chartreusis NRRL 3882 TaxID=1079985 RepID=A0A2N9BEY8_STRCX|nr:LCP family protein [Streptomyces chartreusis]MYS95298.1 LytR family transcriptional regulator [Streptomyces sp. SID5464]SOR81901.1 cell envelope-related function transcriptional attenuator common domain protein [Streptomyces chartreusis NRRL 3882]
MNDRYDPGYGDDQYELVGYDEYGQPVYRQVQAQQPQQQAYDSYAQQQQQGYGYDPYATAGQQPPPAYDYGTGRQQSGYGSYDPYASGQHQGGTASHDPYGQAAAGAGTAQQPRVAEQTAHIPQQAGPADDEEVRDGHQREQREYHTEQFAFVEEPDDNSEDVIDWLKFTENRTERREEARRRARSRIVALVVVLALAAVGGVGYLWYAGKLPGLSSDDSATGTATAAGAQKRDVIVVHLHDTKGGGTATALLVDNTTTKRGTTVLLPNSLALTSDDGTTTTLAKSVEDDGSDGTRDALDTVLGTDIEGTWRLDTPYLQNLVDLVGNIDVDTDTAVPDPDAKKKGEAPLVNKGKAQTLSGKMAVAYATYRAPGEAQNAQLERFGQVLQGVLRKMSSDPQAATTTIQTLAQILDPSLTDKDLGSFLAGLSDLAKGGDYRTDLLPVQADGTLSAQAGEGVVKNVLGGTAKSPDKDAAVSVSVQNATGVKDNTEKARVVLLNGGFTFLEGGTAGSARATSKVTYADAADKADAAEVAKTLGLPAGSVTKGKISASADVAVVLGQDYKPSSD